MAVKTKEKPDLKQGEDDEVKKAADSKDTDAELAGIQAATERAERGDQVGAGPTKPKGVKSKFKVRRNRMILGVAGVGGITGILLGGFMFFGPVYNLGNMVQSLSDINFGPTQDVRGIRQVRLLSDFIRYGRDGVREGNKTGRYRTYVENKWNDINMERIAAKIEANGTKVLFDPDIIDKNGNYPNRKGGKIDGTPRKRVISEILPGPHSDLSGAIFVGPDKKIIQVDSSLAKTYAKFLRFEIDSRVVFGVVNRAHGRGFINTSIGYVFEKYFVDKATSPIGRFYKKLFNPSATANPVDDVRTKDPETGEPIYPGEDGGQRPGVDDAANQVNESKRKFISDVLEGFSPRRVMRSISVNLNKAFSSKITGGAIALIGVQLACVAQQLFEKDIEALWNRYSSLVAYGAQMLTIAGEILNGGFIVLETLGVLYNEFVAYVKTIVDDAGNWIKTVKTAGDSARVQAANGKPVIDGEELAAQNGLYPDKNGAYAIFASVGGLIGGVPFIGDVVGWGCGVLNSWVGQIIDWGATIATCVGSLGIGCGAEVVSELALQVWGDDLFTAIFGLAAGNELGVLPSYPPQSAAILDQSLSILATEQHRSGIPVENDQYNQIVAQYVDQRQEEIKQMPFMERYFAVSTPNSIGQQLAIWRGKAKLSSWTENLASLFRLPFTALGSLFSSPVRAQQADQMCLSINDYRTLDAGGACVTHDNYQLQKYSYDALIQCDGKTINLLDGVDVDNPDDDNYGPRWVEEQVLLIMSGENSDCQQFNGKESFAKKAAEVCHGLVFFEEQEPKIDLSKKLPLASDPIALGPDEAERRNNDVRSHCEDNPNNDVRSLLSDIDNKQLYALIGRYVDDIIQTDAFVIWGGEFDDAATQ